MFRAGLRRRPSALRGPPHRQVVPASAGGPWSREAGAVATTRTRTTYELVELHVATIIRSDHAKQQRSDVSATNPRGQLRPLSL